MLVGKEDDEGGREGEGGGDVEGDVNVLLGTNLPAIIISKDGKHIYGRHTFLLILQLQLPEGK